MQSTAETCNTQLHGGSQSGELDASLIRSVPPLFRASKLRPWWATLFSPTQWARQQYYGSLGALGVLFGVMYASVRIFFIYGDIFSQTSCAVKVQNSLQISKNRKRLKDPQIQRPVSCQHCHVHCLWSRYRFLLRCCHKCMVHSPGMLPQP